MFSPTPAAQQGKTTRVEHGSLLEHGNRKVQDGSSAVQKLLLSGSETRDSVGAGASKRARCHCRCRGGDKVLLCGCYGSSEA